MYNIREDSRVDDVGSALVLPLVLPLGFETVSLEERWY